MRLEKSAEEARRVDIIKYLEGEPRTCTDIASHDGRLSPDNIATYITRLRKRGVLISRHTRGHYMAYKLDMPLKDALKLVKPKGYAPSTLRHIKSQLPETVKAREIRRAEQWALDKAIKEHIPAGEFHPWWGIICKREAIDCGIIATVDQKRYT